MGLSVAGEVKKKVIICPECFGNPEIPIQDAPGHLLQHWAEEPDRVKCPEGNRRYHNLRDQIAAAKEVV